MKIVRNTAKILSALYVAWWVGLLVFFVIAKEQDAPQGEISLFSVKPVFIIFSLVGTICSVMLSVSTFSFLSGNRNKRMLQLLTLVVCVIDNLLYLRYFCSHFTGVVVTDEMAMAMLWPWVICTVICAALLFIQLIIGFVGKATLHKRSAAS